MICNSENVSIATCSTTVEGSNNLRVKTGAFLIEGSTCFKNVWVLWWTLYGLTMVPVLSRNCKPVI